MFTYIHTYKHTYKTCIHYGINTCTHTDVHCYMFIMRLIKLNGCIRKHAGRKTCSYRCAGPAMQTSMAGSCS